MLFQRENREFPLYFLNYVENHAVILATRRRKRAFSATFFDFATFFIARDRWTPHAQNLELFRRVLRDFSQRNAQNAGKSRLFLRKVAQKRMLHALQQREIAGKLVRKLRVHKSPDFLDFYQEFISFRARNARPRLEFQGKNTVF